MCGGPCASLKRTGAALTEYLLASLRRLAAAGVDFAAMSANTPHIVFDDLAAAPRSLS